MPPEKALSTEPHEPSITFLRQIRAKMPLKEGHVAFGDGELGFCETLSPIAIRGHDPIVETLGAAENKLFLKASVRIIPNDIDRFPELQVHFFLLKSKQK